MLRTNPSARTGKAPGRRFAVVASRYNARYVESMLRAARTELKKAGATVRVTRVPGAYEIPVTAAILARKHSTPYAAVICLGVILRGETTHAQHIGEAVSTGLAQIAIETGVPVIHEVLLLENEEQARKRCLDPRRNRGIEAARTALEMAKVTADLNRE